MSSPSTRYRPDEGPSLPAAAAGAEHADFTRGQKILRDLLDQMAGMSWDALPTAPPHPDKVAGDLDPPIGPWHDGPVLPRVEAVLARIKAHDARLSAFTHVMGEKAREQAQRLDALDPDQRGPLHGMLVSVKDIIDVEGVVTSCCSYSRLGQVAARDAIVVARLRAAGAVIIGKANCHEFAFGGPAFDLPFPPARNPWDMALFPGGSSSGSGVAVAAGFCDISIGTDTAGSIRLPASHCGVTGFKLGHDAVDMAGVGALSPSLDSIGPLGHSVDDCALVAQVLMGAGWAADDRPPPGLRVAEDGWLAVLDCEAGAKAASTIAHQAAANCGLSSQPVALPDLADIHAAASLVMMHEVATLFASEIRAGFTRFGEVFRNRALLGEGVDAGDYRRARAQCAGLAQRVAMAIGDDVLMLPGYPQGPTPLVTVDKFYFLARPNLNIIANCAGMPVLSLPVMRDETNRPFGIQLMARRGNEMRLIGLGRRLEAALGWPHDLPPSCGPDPSSA